jgi:ABC-type lipoprotein export system ATPase subunit
MLVVTHNMELASMMPRTIRMADGKLIRDNVTAKSTGDGQE